MLLVFIYISCCCCTTRIITDLRVSDWNHLSVEGLWWRTLCRLTASRASDDELCRHTLATPRVVVLVRDAMEKELHRPRTELANGDVHRRQGRIHVARHRNVVEACHRHLFRYCHATLAERTQHTDRH